MVALRVTVANAGPAAEGSAELWCGGERLGATIRYEERLHLRIEPRADGRPWLLDIIALALALDDLERRLGAS
jgi:hypothetical protein